MTKKDELICTAQEIGKDVAKGASNAYTASKIGRDVGGNRGQIIGFGVSAVNELQHITTIDREERINKCVEERVREREEYQKTMTYLMDSKYQKSYVAPAPRPSAMDYNMRQSGAPNHSYNPNFDPQSNQICNIL